MKLIHASGISDVAEIGSAAKEALVIAAHQLLLGGGQVSLDEWVALDADEREAFAQAGQQKRMEDAAIHVAMMGEEPEELEPDQQALRDVLEDA